MARGFYIVQIFSLYGSYFIVTDPYGLPDPGMDSIEHSRDSFIKKEDSDLDDRYLCIFLCIFLLDVACWYYLN